MGYTIWWIRRDVRLQDNQALQSALETNSALLPLFILDPHLITDPPSRRQNFLFAALKNLDDSLRNRGSRLVVLKGDPLQVFQELAMEIEIDMIYVEEDYSPYARKRDKGIAEAFPLEFVTGLTVHHPNSVEKKSGGPYRVFTPYARAWKDLPFPGKPHMEVPEKLPSVDHIQSVGLPDGDSPSGFPPSEEEALERLDRFLSEAVYQYHHRRDRLDLEGTSCLSPYFRFGLLSVRRAAYQVMRLMEETEDKDAGKGLQTWLNELIWREFYHMILYHFPYVLEEAFQEKMRGIQWRQSEKDLQSWKDGLTGYPVVDAAMRQLSETGWMHNRARMIVASFLVKDLLIDWREGEAWFMQNLVDGDPAANNGGWQWTAGVGTDAAPYFRIFNPISQSQKHDHEGKYIYRYVKELRRVPRDYIHEPWEMPQDLQESCGVRIGSDYPAPIVDHSHMRERTLAAYRAASDKGID